MVEGGGGISGKEEEQQKDDDEDDDDYEEDDDYEDDDDFDEDDDEEEEKEERVGGEEPRNKEVRSVAAHEEHRGGSVGRRVGSAREQRRRVENVERRGRMDSSTTAPREKGGGDSLRVTYPSREGTAATGVPSDNTAATLPSGEVIVVFPVVGAETATTIISPPPRYGKRSVWERLLEEDRRPARGSGEGAWPALRGGPEAEPSRTRRGELGAAWSAQRSLAGKTDTKEGSGGEGGRGAGDLRGDARGGAQEASVEERASRLEMGAELWAATYVPPIEPARRQEMVERWSGVASSAGEADQVRAADRRGQLLLVAIGNKTFTFLRSVYIDRKL